MFWIDGGRQSCRQLGPSFELRVESVRMKPDYSAKFCQACGGTLGRKVLVGDSHERLICGKCGFLVNIGPSLLVLTLIFSQEQIMLVKRGTTPYEGKWAPPGGFVESGESLEAAAVREVSEEVGVQLRPEQMIPHAIVSLPGLNQVHMAFLAVLDQPVPLHPSVPEVQDGRWFHEKDYPTEGMWEPAAGFDISRVFDRVRTGRFEFYQQTDDVLRVISRDSSIQYLWKAPGD
jgi:ADP-ribose pyrophosphatase YjhB (NUDIX family)/ribosomal protein S27AE